MSRTYLNFLILNSYPTMYVFIPKSWHKIKKGKYLLTYYPHSLRRYLFNLLIPCEKVIMTQDINDTRENSSIILDLPHTMVREIDIAAKGNNTSREGICRTLISRGLFYEQNKDIIEPVVQEISRYVVARK